MVGGVLSTTVTVAVQLLEAPAESVTVKVTFVVPGEKGPAGDKLYVSALPSGSDELLLTSAGATATGQEAVVFVTF